MLRLKACDGEVRVKRNLWLPRFHDVFKRSKWPWGPRYRRLVISKDDLAKLRASPLIQELIIDE